jgi:hypothetical protein
LFNYKQQQKALIKNRKEKENVLTYLDLINLNSAFLFNFEKIIRTTIKPKIEKLVEKNKEHQKNLQ